MEMRRIWEESEKSKKITFYDFFSIKETREVEINLRNRKTSFFTMVLKHYCIAMELI